VKASDFGWSLPEDREAKVEVVEVNERSTILLVSICLTDGQKEKIQATRLFVFPSGAVWVGKEVAR